MAEPRGEMRGTGMQPMSEIDQLRVLVRMLVKHDADKEARLRALEGGQQTARVQASAHTATLVRRLLAEHTPKATPVVRPEDPYEPHPWTPG